MAYDINRLRQQAIFDQMPDLSGGTMNLSGGGQNGYPTQNIPFPMTEGIPESAARGLPQFPLPQAPPVPSYEAPPPPTPAPSPESINTRTSPQQIAEMVNQFYTPETTSRDRYNRLLDAAPERNKPGWARKLVAGGMAIGSKDPIGTAEGVMYAPYNRDMEDWKTKTQPFGQAAQQENTANINERTLAGNVVTANVNANRYDMQNEAAIERNRIARLKAEGWEMDARNGTTIKMFKPSTGETKDSGIPTRWMTEADKVEAEGKWDVKAAEARGEAAVKTAQASATAGNRDLIVVDGETYQRNPDRSLTPVEGAPKGTPTKIGTPSATRTNTLEANRIKNEKLAEAYQTDPTVKKFIKNIGNGKYDFTPRPVVKADTWWPGDQTVTQEDVDAYDAFRSSIDPSYTPPTSKPATPSKQGATPNQGPNKNIFGQNAPTYGGAGGVSGNVPQDTKGEKSSTGAFVPPGRVVVQDANGKKFHLPAGQLLAFLKANPTFKQVQ